MSQLNRAAIEAAAASGSALDRRNLDLAILENLQMLCAATGTNILAPTNSPQKPIQPAPPTAGLSVTGANGSATVAVTNPTLNVNATLYHEISYSPSATFSSGVTTLPVSPSTHVVVPMPGESHYWRIRSSYDQANWNGYTPAPGGSIAAGLQTSAANSAATSLNVTNYATVDSVVSGGLTNIRVYGAAGPQTMFVAVKGTSETVLPSATIVNATNGTRPVVGYDGEQYLVANTLPGVFADEVVPIGQVQIASATPPVLPTLTAVISGGYVQPAVIDTPGSGMTAPPTLTVTDPTGSGKYATLIAQINGAGALIGTTVGNPGNGAYSGSTTVTASGGLAPSVSGGGTMTGNNGGRLTAIQGG